MFKFGMRRMFLNCFILWTVLMMISFGENSFADISIRCPKACVNGEKVFTGFVKRLGLADAVLWDARRSQKVPGYWHLSFKDASIDQGFIVLTNGTYMIPHLLPVVPDKTAHDSNRSQITFAPQNQAVIEQNGMLMGDIHPEVWAEKLISGNRAENYILIVDTLWDGKAAAFLDAFRNLDKRWKKYHDYTVYFAPFFGFMGDERTAVIGKQYHALMKTGVRPAQAVYALSRLEYDVKMNHHRLREYAHQLVGPKKKAELDKNLLSIPSSSVFAMNKETIKIGVMLPQYYIVNDRIYFWRIDE